MSDDRDRPDAPGGSDVRAGDVIAGRVPEHELDPYTIAQLAAWFGAPPPDDGPTEEPEMDELSAIRQRALDAVDPDFLAQIEARETADDGLAWEPRPIALHVERPLNKFELSAWRLNLIEIREYEVPDDIEDCVRERTPQAVLRDLHRPVDTWPILFRPRSFGLDFDGRKAREQMNQALRTRYRVSPDEIPLATRTAADEMAALRARLAEPWEDCQVPEDQRSTLSTMPSAEDLKWFGTMGYDPDL